MTDLCFSATPGRDGHVRRERSANPWLIPRAPCTLRGLRASGRGQRRGHRPDARLANCVDSVLPSRHHVPLGRRKRSLEKERPRRVSRWLRHIRKVPTAVPSRRRGTPRCAPLCTPCASGSSPDRPRFGQPRVLHARVVTSRGSTVAHPSPNPPPGEHVTSRWLRLGTPPTREEARPGSPWWAPGSPVSPLRRAWRAGAAP